MTASTDRERASELNSKVTVAYAKTPTDPQHAVDLALARLSANNELLSVKQTRTAP